MRYQRAAVLRLLNRATRVFLRAVLGADVAVITPKPGKHCWISVSPETNLPESTEYGTTVAASTSVGQRTHVTEIFCDAPDGWRLLELTLAGVPVALGRRPLAATPGPVPIGPYTLTAGQIVHATFIRLLAGTRMGPLPTLTLFGTTAELNVHATADYYSVS